MCPACKMINGKCTWCKEAEARTKKLIDQSVDKMCSENQKHFKLRVPNVYSQKMLLHEVLNRSTAGLSAEDAEYRMALITSIRVMSNIMETEAVLTKWKKEKGENNNVA